MRKKVSLFILAAIVILASILRFYKLSEAPPAISWDEAAVGYNAWAILNWGRDEWGKFLPLVFKSFEDYKHPVHIYLSVPFIAIFGLNELGVRASSAFFGVANVFLMFFLASRVFKNKWAGVLAALVLAVSPYNLHFSRFNHELNFAVFFFILGLYFFYLGLERKNIFLTLGFASLGLDLLIYHSAKFIVPATLTLLLILYFKELWRVKKYFLAGVLVFSFFISLLLIEPELLGTARLRQTSSPEERKLENIVKKYKSHFSYDFLFARGDPNARLSSQSGTFYKIDLPFLVLGAVALFWGIIKKRRREYLVIIAWALLAPIPAAVGSEVPHAARAMFMTGSWHLVLVLGLTMAWSLLKVRPLRILFASLYLGFLAYSTIDVVRHYYSEYAPRYAIEWQYGMREIVEYVKEHPEYDEVYTTAERQQPYIFYLFYLKYPLPNFLATVQYNETQSRSANTVAGFGRYNFGLWDPIESRPTPSILYVVTPSYYTGLRHKLLFETVKEIKYPNGTKAFYLVTAKKYE